MVFPPPKPRRETARPQNERVIPRTAFAREMTMNAEWDYGEDELGAQRQVEALLDYEDEWPEELDTAILAG